MKTKSTRKPGRPKTGQRGRLTIRLSAEARAKLEQLADQPNGRTSLGRVIERLIMERREQ